MPNNFADSALYLPLEMLSFDPHNPRLPSFLRGSKPDEEIIDYLLRDEGLTDLMASIAQTGYAKAEPLLVIPGEGSEYIVVEGNRRLAALKLLSNPASATVRKVTVGDIASSAKFTPTEIPVIKYSTRDEIIDYLGYRHITGIKEWDSMAKARYLEQLYNRHKGNYDNDANIFLVLAKMIGSKSNYVARLLTALRICDFANDKAYFKLPISEPKIEFSLVTTALSYSNIVKFLGLESADNPEIPGINENNCKELFQWMFVKDEQSGTRLGESRALKDLSKIVSFPEALLKFRQGASIAEAVLYTDEPNDTFMNFIVKARDSLKNAKNCLEQLSGTPDGSEEVLKEIDNITKTIQGSLNARFTAASLEGLSADDIARIKTILSSVKSRESV